jgi:peptidyl-prolyl cis-trans isomerase C
LVAAIFGAVCVPLISRVIHAQNSVQQVALADSAAASAGPGPSAAAPTTAPAIPEVDPATVIVTQGDIEVTAGEFNAILATLPPQYMAAMSDPAIKKRLADRIIQVKELAQEARRRKLQDKAPLKQQLEMQEDQLLANALAAEVQKDQTDADKHAYYDAYKSSFDNVKARHILVRAPGSPVPANGQKELTEAEAKAKADQIEARLAKGEDFGAIAKVESDDKGSGLKGGDLGTFAPWRMDPVFSKATLALKKNQTSEPVRSQFGYHIIQLLEDEPRTYDQAKDEVGEAQWNQLMSSLKTNAKPEYNPAFFGGGASAPATQPAEKK